MHTSKWMVAFILVLVVSVSLVHAQTTEEPWKVLDRNTDLTGYCITGKIPVTGGVLEILQDPMYAKPDWREVVDPLSKDYEKLKKAILRFQHNGGEIIEIKELERPTVKFVKNRICPDVRGFYLLEVDYSAGWGSYSGPVTFMLKVKNNRLSLIQRLYQGTEQELNLIKSLKTGWWLSPKMFFGCHDVLQLFCRPDFEGNRKGNNSDAFDENDFKLTYRRYHFDGTKWVVTEKERRGFWENESRPAESLFPQ